jgi:hypothetical protein
MRRYVELIILYNLSPYRSFWVRRKYSYTCSAWKNYQGQRFSALTKNYAYFNYFDTIWKQQYRHRSHKLRSRSSCSRHQP